MTIALNGLYRWRLLTFTRWSCSIWAIFAALTVPTLPSPARVVPAGEDTSTTKLAGVWSFDGRSGCKSGMAWVLIATDLTAKSDCLTRRRLAEESGMNAAIPSFTHCREY